MAGRSSPLAVLAGAILHLTKIFLIVCLVYTRLRAKLWIRATLNRARFRWTLWRQGIPGPLRRELGKEYSRALARVKLPAPRSMWKLVKGR